MRKHDLGFPTARKCIALRCARLHRFVTGIFDNALADAGITAAQLSVLMTIREDGWSTASQLRTDLHMDRSTVSKHVRWLKQHELIAVEPHADRRVKVITLTGKGVRTVRSAHLGWRRAQDRVMALLGPLSGIADLGGKIQNLRSPRPERRQIRSENFFRADA